MSILLCLIFISAQIANNNCPNQFRKAQNQHAKLEMVSQAPGTAHTLFFDARNKNVDCWLAAGWVLAWRDARQSWPRKLRADTWHGVHSSSVRAADCRAAGPWSKSGCALFVISWHYSCNCARSTKDKTGIVQPLPSTSPNQVCRTFPPIPNNLPQPFNTFADHFPQDLPAIFVAFARVPFPLLAFARILSVQFVIWVGPGRGTSW